jgi:ATP-binding cassette subfamily F protein 3
LLRNCVDEFWLVADGGCAAFDGDLDDYHRRLARSTSSAVTTAPTPPAAPSANALAPAPASARERRQLAAAQRARLAPLRKAQGRIEAELALRRARLEQIEKLLEDEDLYGAARKSELGTALEERASLLFEAARLEEEWLTREDELEQLSRAAAD